MNVYFVLYGEFDFQSGAAMAKFGERVKLGWTIGEEVLFTKQEAFKRLETVRSIKESCLLQLKVSDLELMAKPTKNQAGGYSYKTDYDILMSFLV